MSLLSDFLHNHAPPNGWSTLFTSYAPQNGWGTFFTAALGAFAGAFAASRAHNKRTLVAELNAVNAAHQLSVAIANMFLGFKRQNVLPLKQEFERIEAAYNNHRTMLQNGVQVAQPFHYRADFQSLSVLATPQAALEKMIFEKTLVRGRALAALVTLVGAIDGVGIAIKARNEMVEERRTAAQWTDQERLEFLLGIRTAAGVEDARYRTSLDGIVAQTDDCIFFAKILATDLAKYANKLKQKEGRFYLLRVPNIAEINWIVPETTGLMPRDADYESWLRGFPPRPSRWEQLRARIPFLQTSA